MNFEMTSPENKISPNAMMSDLIHYMKYASYLETEQRRETYEETTQRNMNMHLARFPGLRHEIEEAYQLVFARKILPAMRSLQFAGQAIIKNPCRMFNCSFMHIDNPDAFHEAFFLLLAGCGVGFSVQQHHVAKLPLITRSSSSKPFMIEDSIEGWALAVKALMYSFCYGNPFPEFVYDLIRPQGMRLKTSGGIAPGPEPLKKALQRIASLLKSKKEGSRLSPLECHDIMCFMSCAVLAGGIRRSSYISLFSPEDQEMMACKSGNWLHDNPQRAMANNSAVFLRSSLDEKTFWKFWEKIASSTSGEPNIFQTNSLDWGTNPCGEINGANRFFCNLVETNASNIEDQDDFDHRARMASRIATIQASYTWFHLLHNEWQKNAERDALIGVGMTGIAAGKVLDLDMTRAANCVLAENERFAAMLGINPAKRTTTVKPAGTGSLLLSNGTLCSSGIHGYEGEFIKRRITILHTEPLYNFIKENQPNLLEQSVYNPKKESFVVIPLAAPPHGIMRSEGSLGTLERIKKVYREWVLPGHREGVNTNNVSSTVIVKQNEWDQVGQWWWNNRENFVSITFLAENNKTYPQMPIEAINQETYEAEKSKLRLLDFRAIKEFENNTKPENEAACSGGMCELL